MQGEIIRTSEDKSGSTVAFTKICDGDKPELIAMYDVFSPKAVTQGLPPASDTARLQWVEGLLASGINFLAWVDDIVIGHAALILDPEKNDGEYLIFVNQKIRNKGVGTQLTDIVLQEAKVIGIKSIWLTVEALNFRAIKLYKKMGFVFCDSGERERTMILHL